MAWYLAPSLATGRAEVNKRWPNRDTKSDGTIGDAAHATRKSDHNPNERESVNAWDMDKDGVEVNTVISAFMKHPSAHYVIWNKRIADADDGWKWRTYTGDNPHTAHVHFSIRQSRTAEQDRRPWGIFPVPTVEDDGMFTDEDKARLRNVEQYLSAVLSGQPARGLWDGDSYVERPNILAGMIGDTANTTRATETLVKSLVDRQPVDPLAFVTALIQTPEAVALLYAALDERLAIVPTVDEIVKATLRTLRDNVLSNPQNGVS